MPKRDVKTITLGSGKLYVDEFTGTIPEYSAIEQDSKILGYIQGGANVQYSPEFYTAEDDLGYVKKTKLIKEEVKMKSGIMTWNGAVLSKICATGRTTEENGVRTTKIGGLKNDNGKSYVLHFLHEDPVDGNVRVTIVGKNSSGFDLSFQKDKETVVDAEFVALPNDSDGTLLIIDEEIGATV